VTDAIEMKKIEEKKSEPPKKHNFKSARVQSTALTKAGAQAKDKESVITPSEGTQTISA
jgi:hypothetical protein